MPQNGGTQDNTGHNLPDDRRLPHPFEEPSEEAAGQQDRDDLQQQNADGGFDVMMHQFHKQVKSLAQIAGSRLQGCDSIGKLPAFPLFGDEIHE